VLFSALWRVRCPDCGGPLPVLYSPFVKTRRMWLEGGYLCPSCGCESDPAGRKVTADTRPARFPAAQAALLAILLLAGAGMATTGYLLTSKSPVPPAAAAPPAAALPPQQALPMARPN
jgi:hypothetical protein